MPGLTQRQLSGIWMGFADNAGATAGLFGDSLVVGYLQSIANPDNVFDFSLFSWRFGPGLGASAGTALVVATSLYAPRELNGRKEAGCDFQLSLDEKWGALAKSLPKLKTLTGLAKSGVRLAKRAIKIGKAVEDHDWIISIVKDLDLDVDAREPKVSILDLPLGIGLEASAYYETGSFAVGNVRFQEARSGATR